MPFYDSAFWSDRLQRTLESYDEALLRSMAARLFKPRNQWPFEELVERSVTTVAENSGVVNRRLQDLELPSRLVLTLMARSRQPRWRLGNLLEMLAALGHAEGPQPIFALFDSGLLFPELANTIQLGAGASPARLKSFEQWLGLAGGTDLAVFTHPHVMSLAINGQTGLGEFPHEVMTPKVIHEADGLDFLLRLAAVWQQLINNPLRKTQSGDLFKRDLDRLRSDPVLNAPGADNLAEVLDTGLLTLALARTEGIVESDESEFRAGTLPASWDDGLPATLMALWSALPLLEGWNPLAGWSAGQTAGNPYPSAYLLSLLLLAELPENGWAHVTEIESWILANHPYWKNEDLRPSQRKPWLQNFLMGFAFTLRLLQAAKDEEGEWAVRLSVMGKWLLGLSSTPPAAIEFPQTLLVQPNLEIIVYRQGLKPSLLNRLSRFATWKSLGAACTLQLEANAAYRALESGLSFQEILQTLEKYGMREIPSAVVESLRTWSDKRDRLSVYPSATLFEFADKEDLEAALARGLLGIRLSDRLLVVANEGSIDFRQFRLAGTRDYALPPEKCVEVDADGITLSVDLTRSDLLLETEILRFADALDGAGVNGRRRFRLTPESLSRGQQNSLDIQFLEDWFYQRTGQALSPAARLLLTGSRTPPLELRQQLVLYVATPEIADGLLQWPGTRELIQDRLGPTALVVSSEEVAKLKEQLVQLGITLQIP